MDVLITSEAQKQFEALPRTIQARVLTVFERLCEWPDISGVKPLHEEWEGYRRIRTGDWRIVFRLQKLNDKDSVLVVRIAHRKEVYE